MAGYSPSRALPNATLSMSVPNTCRGTSLPALARHSLIMITRGIHLLAGGAARHPDPQCFLWPKLVQELRHHLFFNGLERLGIPEEAGHSDQKVLEQAVELTGIGPDIAKVFFNPADLLDAHATLDTSYDRALLVTGKIMSHLVSQQHQDLVYRLLAERFFFGCFCAIGDWPMRGVEKNR